MQGFCARWAESMLPDLENDFNRLFVGPAQPLAPPWESYYLSRDRLLFQEQTLEVREIYQRLGLRVEGSGEGGVEPDDSLSLELCFMAELCARCVAALETGADGAQAEILEAQRQFLTAHLSKWAPRCLRLVVEHATHDYYRAAAFLALGCLFETGRILGLELSLPPL